MPLAQEKTVRPSLQVTFLGVELDTVRNETRLPRDKLENYLEQLRDLKSKKFCTQRELKTLIGKLQFATCVIQGGRGFLRRLHDKWQGPFKPEARIFLSLSTKKDLEIWENFLQVWIGSKLSSFIQMRMCNFTPLQQRLEPLSILYNGSYEKEGSKWQTYDEKFRKDRKALRLRWSEFRQQLHAEAIAGTRDRSPSP